MKPAVTRVYPPHWTWHSGHKMFSSLYKATAICSPWLLRDRFQTLLQEGTRLPLNSRRKYCSRAELWITQTPKQLSSKECVPLWDKSAPYVFMFKRTLAPEGNNQPGSRTLPYGRRWKMPVEGQHMIKVSPVSKMESNGVKYMLVHRSIYS